MQRPEDEWAVARAIELLEPALPLVVSEGRMDLVEMVQILRGLKTAQLRLLADAVPPAPMPHIPNVNFEDF